jgi:hypothetical protein
VYDVTDDAESFMLTTRKIAEYVSKNFDDAKELRLGMVNMSLDPLDEPTAPTDADNVIEVTRWKLQMSSHMKLVEARARNLGKAYSLVLGQCSNALRSRLEAHQHWDSINDGSDLMGLLSIIQACMVQRETRGYDIEAIQQAERRALTFKQTKWMSDYDYYQKFKDLVEDAERMGGEIGQPSKKIEAEAVRIAEDPEDITTAEKERSADHRERAVPSRHLPQQLRSSSI